MYVHGIMNHECNPFNQTHRGFHALIIIYWRINCVLNFEYIHRKGNHDLRQDNRLLQHLSKWFSVKEHSNADCDAVGRPCKTANGMIRYIPLLLPNISSFLRYIDDGETAGIFSLVTINLITIRFQEQNVFICGE